MQALDKEKVRLLVIHCADTPNGKDFTPEQIDEWHKERGFRRAEDDKRNFNPQFESIGYHYVITVDGSIHTGRALSERGAHVKGYNSRSVGVCMVGRDEFTQEQWNSLDTVVGDIDAYFGKRLTRMGHCQLDDSKTCPGFDVPSWFRKTLEGHIYGD